MIATSESEVLDYINNCTSYTAEEVYKVDNRVYARIIAHDLFEIGETYFDKEDQELKFDIDDSSWFERVE